jgi:hypothetical protein
MAPRLTLGLILLLLAAGLLAACTETPSNFGRYFRGRTLDVVLVALDRVPELRYSTIQQVPAPTPTDTPCASQLPAPTPDPNAPPVEPGKLQHWRITPSQPELELVLLHIKVENHTATSVIVTVDEDAAELRDFASTIYRPLTVSQRVQETVEPPGPQGRSLVFVQGDMELKRDCGVDGWLVFEAPKGTKFREFRWRASDSLSIDF